MTLLIINSLKIIFNTFKKNKLIDAVYSNVTIVDRQNIKVIKRIFNSRQLSYNDF